MPRRQRKHREGGAKRTRGRSGQPLAASTKRDLVVIDRLRQILPKDELSGIVNHAAADSDPIVAKKWLGLLNDMLNPARKRETLATMAFRHGLRASQVIDAVRKYRLDLAMLQATAHLPEVVESAAEDSKRHTEPCPKCEGEGTLERKVKEPVRDAEGNPTDSEVEVVKRIPCKVCNGVGTVMMPGDAQARRLFAEMLGLVGKGASGGTVVNVNQQNQTLSVGAGAVEGLEELLRKGRERQLAGEQKALPAAEVVEVIEGEGGESDAER